MNIIECTNPDEGLNLNPHQIFVFVNERTHRLVQELEAYSRSQRSFEFIFIEADPRKRFMYDMLDEYKNMMLYQNVMFSDMVCRIMPSRQDDYRYITETFPSSGEWADCISAIKKLTRRLKEEQYRSIEETLLTFIAEKDADFSAFMDKAYDGHLEKFEMMSEEFAEQALKGHLLKSEEFTFKFFKELGKDLSDQLKDLMAESVGYADEEESYANFQEFISLRKAFEQPSKQDIKIVISPAVPPNSLQESDGLYNITVEEGEKQYTLSFSYKGAKMLYLLTLLSQKKIGGLPTNYFTTDIAQDVVAKIYNKIYYIGGTDFVDYVSSHIHQISVYRNHANTDIKEHRQLSYSQKYWCRIDDENKKVEVRNRKVQLRRTRMSADQIIIIDSPNDEETLSDLVMQLPPLESLFGLRNTKTLQYLEKIGQNIKKAGKAIYNE